MGWDRRFTLRFLPKPLTYEGTSDGIVKLRQISAIFSRARPTPRPQINKLAVVLGGENANKLPNLTMPSHLTPVEEDLSGGCCCGDFLAAFLDVLGEHR
jgi:hypothetical protein